jgi:hypothetical protein
MIDHEVERLRRLRASALGVRAVAKALHDGASARPEPYAARSQHAAWRIARTITGHLRAHPFEQFQKGAGLGILVANRIVAMATVLASRRPDQVRARLHSVLRRLARELDDARAVTWSPELSDSFGRAQLEIRSLLLELQSQTQALDGNISQPVQAAALAIDAMAPADWPYLAI